MKALSLWILLAVVPLTSSSQAQKKLWDPVLDTLQQRTIQWFLDGTPEKTGLAPDRSPADWSPSSVAAIGFALTIYPIAAERNMITRAQAAQRILATLRYLWSMPQGSARSAIAGYRGFFYHFLKKKNGFREWDCELSTIDTGLLLAGALFCQSYFDRNSQIEKEIRSLADSLYLRVDWPWAMDNSKGIKMGWTPEKGFHPWIWHGYNEAMIMYLLALGSLTHPVPPSAWDTWTKSYVWKEHYGQTLLQFQALFGHQFSHAWIDFRGIQDAYMQGKGIDYFENSRRATYAHRAYAIKNPLQWSDYSDSVWGLTACDGAKDTAFSIQGKWRRFRSYSARGTGAAEADVDDGTIAPTAAASSVAFAPEIVIPAIKAMKNKYGERVWTKYGFVDAFNPAFITPSTPNGWFDKDYLGIDQGPIVLMIENYRTGLVWNVMKKNKYLVAGLRKAGFKGAWLENKTIHEGH